MKMPRKMVVNVAVASPTPDQALPSASSTFSPSQASTAINARLMTRPRDLKRDMRGLYHRGSSVDSSHAAPRSAHQAGWHYRSRFQFGAADGGPIPAGRGLPHHRRAEPARAPERGHVGR